MLLSFHTFVIYLAVMAGVTYLIRAVPFALCQGEIKNRFIQSFLAYVPYAVLAAMTFPAIWYSTGGLASGLAATVTALVLAYRRQSLLTVAMAASGVAFVVLAVNIWL